MYEYLRKPGLGWSDHLVDGEFQECGQVVGGIKKCFTTTADDRACAQNSGCFELTDRCTTTSEGTGNLWCCPRHLPPPPGMPCVAQSTEMVCHSHEVRCTTLENRQEYAVCRVQKALCEQGVDPGPIDGRGDSDMFPIAVRMYKARVGITPADDDIRSRQFLERLGISEDPQVTAGVDEYRGTGLPPIVTNWFWPVAFGMSTIFLGFSWWRYGRGQ